MLTPQNQTRGDLQYVTVRIDHSKNTPTSVKSFLKKIVSNIT